MKIFRTTLHVAFAAIALLAATAQAAPPSSYPPIDIAAQLPDDQGVVLAADEGREVGVVRLIDRGGDLVKLKHPRRLDQGVPATFSFPWMTQAPLYAASHRRTDASARHAVELANAAAARGRASLYHSLYRERSGSGRRRA